MAGNALSKEEIIRLVHSGNTLADIARAMNIPYSTASHAIKETTSQLFKQIKNSHAATRFRELIPNSLSLGKIANEMNMSRSIASLKIKKTFGKGYRELTKDSFMLEVGKFISSPVELQEVRKRFNYAPLTFYSVLLKSGLGVIFNKHSAVNSEELSKIRKGLGKHRMEMVDSLVDEGYEIIYIANKIGKKRQHVDYYLRGSSQYPYWKELSSLRRGILSLEREEAKTKLVSLIKAHYT